MKPDSSISNSEFPGVDPDNGLPIMRFAAKLSMVVACFAIFEIAAHMFSPVVHPLQEPSNEKQRIYERVLNNGSSHYDLFMIGSSMTQSAFDPDVFDPIFGGRSFNAGIAGRSNTSWQLEMLNEIIARKKPKTVLYAIESWSLSVAPHVPSIPSTQMFRFLKLYQNRDQILSWLKEARSGHFSTPPFFVPIDDNMFLMDKRFQIFRTQTVHQSGFLDVDAVGRVDYTSIPGPFKVLPEQAHAFETMMKTARAAGVELVFVQLPEYIGEIERWRERHAAFRAYMLENAVAKGFIYLDFNLELAFPRDRIEFFYDVNHLNGTGARQFSAVLAKLMKERTNSALKVR